MEPNTLTCGLPQVLHFEPHPPDAEPQPLWRRRMFCHIPVLEVDGRSFLHEGLHDDLRSRIQHRCCQLLGIGWLGAKACASQTWGALFGKTFFKSVRLWFPAKGSVQSGSRRVSLGLVVSPGRFPKSRPQIRTREISHWQWVEHGNIPIGEASCC